MGVSNGKLMERIWKEEWSLAEYFARQPVFEGEGSERNPKIRLETYV
jgi:hypothetical protein